MTTTRPDTTALVVTKDRILGTGPNGAGFAQVGLHKPGCRGYDGYRVGKVLATHATLDAALTDTRWAPCYACFGGKQVTIEDGHRYLAGVMVRPTRTTDGLAWIVTAEMTEANFDRVGESFTDYEAARTFANAQWAAVRNTHA